MLTKRTQILFDQEMWRQLNYLAKEEKTSVGKIVRDAVEERVQKDKRLEKIKIACAKIESIRVKQKGKVDYKELINYGRKY